MSDTAHSIHPARATLPPAETYRAHARKLAAIFAKMADLEREAMAEIEAMKADDLRPEEFTAMLEDGKPMTLEAHFVYWIPDWDSEMHSPPNRGDEECVMAGWARHFEELAKLTEETFEPYTIGSG